MVLFGRTRKNKTQEIRYRTSRIERQADDSDTTRLNVSISSEEPVEFERWNSEISQYEKWSEVLSHAKGAVDLKRANTNAPLLYNHNRNTVIGVIEKAYIENKQVRADIRLSEAGHIKGYVDQIREGVLANMSIGYWVEKYKEDKTNKEMRATKCNISEASIVGQPADLTVGIGRSHDNHIQTHLSLIHI